jgi:hypothetical protein
MRVTTNILSWISTFNKTCYSISVAPQQNIDEQQLQHQTHLKEHILELLVLLVMAQASYKKQVVKTLQKQQYDGEIYYLGSQEKIQ